MTNSDFIYGKGKLTKVVGLEINDDEAHVFYQDNGIKQTTLPNKFWILYAENYEGNFIRLEGDLHYRYADKFDYEDEYRAAINKARSKNWDIHYAYNLKEMFMLKNGLTFYRGLHPKDVSTLSFDIETTGLVHDESSKVLLISNTFRTGKYLGRKLFSYDDYDSQEAMVKAWCDWVRLMDPSIMIGHNILGFDLPYLKFVGKKLELGRNGKAASFSRHFSKFRKDGSQSYDYKNVSIYGREIVDTFHLAIKFDIARNYPSYSLKQIIKYEGLERKDRQHFDASKIKDLYKDTSEWTKIKKYAEHDADDSLALFDLMAPSFFYYSQHLPKTFQQVINGASGSQVDSFMKRAYLQLGHSLPLSSERIDYEGGISFGNPGLYKHVNKVDVASLYPSIILMDNIYDCKKDPKAYFLEMVDYFTTERLRNKQLAKESGQRYYKDLEQSQKIFINSAYGFMGASGLLFNSPISAARITETGRKILERGIEWAKAKGYQIVNADTDSFSYTTGGAITSDVFKLHISQLNRPYMGKIRWEDDGQYKKVLIVKAKNYVLDDGKELKIKGSSLKATMKEPALKEFINGVIYYLIKERKDQIYDYYMDYVNSICNISSGEISEWCSKKTITKAVLKPERTNEQRIKEAIGQKEVNEGDKIFVFFEECDKLCLVENFNGKYCRKTLHKKLFKTLEIFSTLLDVSIFPNYALKRNEVRIETK